jgi:polyhydroxybutyrate depolymerase
MHGSGGDSARMRRDSGFAFERLADERGFALVYPDGFEGYWNACNVVGDYSANALDIDDVGFLTELSETLAAELGIDPARVFAAGVSRGGHMAFRLALEAPQRFRAVAAIAANVPAPENFKCDATGQGTAAVMLMNGTSDPLNPFNGGEVRLLGMFGRGEVLSSRQSGQFFADLNGIEDAPVESTSEIGDGMRVERIRWRSEAAEIELVAIQGGGHVIPQPYARAPRLLGRTARDLNGPAEIIAFFERQAGNHRN